MHTRRQERERQGGLCVHAGCAATAAQRAARKARESTQAGGVIVGRGAPVGSLLDCECAQGQQEEDVGAGGQT